MAVKLWVVTPIVFFKNGVRKGGKMRRELQKHNNLRMLAVLVAPLLLLIFAFPGHADLYLEAVTENSQSLRYVKGEQVLISKKQESGVVIALLNDYINPNQPVDFGLAIRNDSSQPVNFSINNIRALNSTTMVKVFTPEESLAYESQAHESQGADLFTMQNLFGVDASFLAMMAPLISEQQEKRLKQLGNYNAQLLRRQTILPNNFYQGVFKIAYPGSVDSLRVEVIAGRETHLFTFKVEKR